MAKHWKALLAAGSLALAVSQAHAEDQQLIKRGEYLAIAGDCGACHTEAGKAPFSGGHAIASPLGTIFSTNITPLKRQGSANTASSSLPMRCVKGFAVMAVSSIRRCLIPLMRS